MLFVRYLDEHLDIEEGVQILILLQLMDPLYT